uniref:2-oxoglutarate dehydrogenase E1 subunit family protein n=1 Tax=Catellatospora paridis TaxID=1617086 RepID=UPI0012D3AC46
MSTQHTSGAGPTGRSVQDNPLASFGPNEWIVEEMYQRYLADPTSVDPAWHDFFADYKPADSAPAAAKAAAPAKPAAPAQPAAAPAATAPAPVAP